jgi:hypothetical protein
MWRSRGRDSSKIERKPRSAYQRREVLKLGAAVGLGAPAILTLASTEARASGSWKTMGPNQARAKGSWSGEGRVIDRHLEDVQSHRSAHDDGFVVPGSYEWRLRRDAEKEEHDRLLGEFKRFGHED